MLCHAIDFTIAMHIEDVVAARLWRRQLFPADVAGEAFAAMHAGHVLVHRFGPFKLFAASLARASPRLVDVEAV